MHNNRKQLSPNSALLTDAFSSLRCACGAARRERYATGTVRRPAKGKCLILIDPARSCQWVLLSLVLTLAGCSHAPVQSQSPATLSPTAATTRALRLATGPVAVQTYDVDYLQVDGKTFKA